MPIPSIPPYNPETFTALYNTPMGVSTWALLNEPVNITRLETSTALGRPGIEGIEAPLLEHCGEAILDDRFKRMVGHMVRQILERLGYVIDQSNVKITNGALFSRGTRYRRRDARTFHVFKNLADPRQLALTSDKAGTKLPTDTKWVYWKSFEDWLRGRIVFGIANPEVALADLEAQGFHLWRLERVLRAAS